MAKTYYVYRIEDKISGEFYFGYRGCNGRPIDDIGKVYFTSGILRSHFAKVPDVFKINILYESSNRRDCYWREQRYIFIYFTNKLCRNYNYCKKVVKMPLRVEMNLW